MYHCHYFWNKNFDLEAHSDHIFWQGNIPQTTQEHFTLEKLVMRIIRIYRIMVQGLLISVI